MRTQYSDLESWITKGGKARATWPDDTIIGLIESNIDTGKSRTHLGVKDSEMRLETYRIV